MFARHFEGILRSPLLTSVPGIHSLEKGQSSATFSRRGRARVCQRCRKKCQFNKILSIFASTRVHPDFRVRGSSSVLSLSNKVEVRSGSPTFWCAKILGVEANFLKRRRRSDTAVMQKGPWLYERSHPDTAMRATSRILRRRS